MSQSSLAVDVSKVDGSRRDQLADSVAIEEPLEIRLGYSTEDGRASKSLSITMRTPGDDFELAAGFLVSESIIRSGKDILSIEYCGKPAPDSGLNNVVRVELAGSVTVDTSRLQRHFYTTSSCGVCGKASLEALETAGMTPLTTNTSTFSRQVLSDMPDRLRAQQDVFEQTGGLHAAAAFTTNGEIVCLREDVGRHNAVDKVVGRLLLDDQLPAGQLGLIVSGRASFELMQKALCAGMPLLAAISAPSSLAVKLARDFDMSLVGFLRGSRFNVYAGDQRVSDA
ncbi:MAG: formate dehydrogenase accessory sulfurtransferase FdhD [Woeseiaceae bacterium]|nr:formate dehydrogenase accessory sulfurtransferase FdhD [Woeseiaceae bacterium]